LTFRDDHDAALARADALEQELDRAKRERDALKAQVEKLEHAPKPGPVPATTSIVRVPPMPLERAELSRLVQLIEESADEAGSQRAVLIVLLVALLPFTVVFAVLGGASMLWITGLVGGLLVAGILGGQGSSAADASAVIEAITSEPERILAVSQVSGRYRSVLIETSQHKVRTSGAHSAELIALLARRCPKASFDGG
jgi:hypothetical protein